MEQRLKYILLASIGLNLLLVGMFFGYYAKGCRPLHPPGPPPPPFAQTLSPEKKTLVDQAMRDLHEKNRVVVKKLESNRAAALALLTAPQFDAQAFAAKLQEVQQSQDQMRENFSKTLLTLASALGPEERKGLSGMLNPPPFPPGERSGGMHPPGGPPMGPPGGPPPGPPPGMGPPPPL